MKGLLRESGGTNSSLRANLTGIGLSFTMGSVVGCGSQNGTKDTDGDGLSDKDEIKQYGTDPTL